jgi:hypothetical protein
VRIGTQFYAALARLDRLAESGLGDLTKVELKEISLLLRKSVSSQTTTPERVYRRDLIQERKETAKIESVQVHTQNLEEVSIPPQHFRSTKIENDRKHSPEWVAHDEYHWMETNND